LLELENIDECFRAQGFADMSRREKRRAAQQGGKKAAADDGDCPDRWIVLYRLDKRRHAGIIEMQSGKHEIDAALREPAERSVDRVHGDELEFVAEQLACDGQPAWARRNQYDRLCHVRPHAFG
jgi:hypothetical protein